jgi:hypothetical protein
MTEAETGSLDQLLSSGQIASRMARVQETPLMRLKQITPDSLDPTIYCTIADQGETATHRVTVPWLANALKVDSILGQHVYVSASHLFSSDTTPRALERVAPLVEVGAIVLGLRKDCADLLDFAELFLESRAGTARSESSEAIRARAKRLNHLFKYMIRWSPPAQQELLQESLLQTLANPESIVRRRLRGISRHTIDDLSRHIADTPVDLMSRRRVGQIALRCLDLRGEVLMREVNTLYYSIGASAEGLVPNIHRLYFDDIRDGANKSLRTTTHQSSVDAFREYLRAFSLSTTMIRSLTPIALAELRDEHASVMKGLRRKWWEIVTARAEGDPSTSHAFSDLLQNAILKEKRSISGYEHATKVVAVGSFLISLASFPGNATVAAISAGVSLLSALSGSRRVKERATKSYLHVLSTYLQGSAHPRSGRGRLR